MMTVAWVLILATNGVFLFVICDALWRMADGRYRDALYRRCAALSGAVERSLQRRALRAIAEQHSDV